MVLLLCFWWQTQVLRVHHRMTSPPCPAPEIWQYGRQRIFGGLRFTIKGKCMNSLASWGPLNFSAAWWLSRELYLYLLSGVKIRLQAWWLKIHTTCGIIRLAELKNITCSTRQKGQHLHLRFSQQCYAVILMLHDSINFKHLTSIGFWDVFVLFTCKMYPWCTWKAGDQWEELFICSKWNLRVLEKATAKH